MKAASREEKKDLWRPDFRYFVKKVMQETSVKGLIAARDASMWSPDLSDTLKAAAEEVLNARLELLRGLK
jgi:hypothetical protein